MIKIICIGKIKEDYIKEGIIDYCKRITKYSKFEIIELEEEKSDDKNLALKREKEKILKAVKLKDNLVIMDVVGQELNSLEFADFIDKQITKSNNITFLIGSSHGIHEDIKNIATLKISLSKMTFPHQLFRLILLEQIYRAYKINNNERYHK